MNSSTRNWIAKQSGSLIGVPAAFLLNGLIVMLYWNWFAHHVWTGAPKLGYPSAVGLVILLSYLLGRRFNTPNFPTMDDVIARLDREKNAPFRLPPYEEYSRAVAKAFGRWVIKGAQTATSIILFGWILHQFV